MSQQMVNGSHYDGDITVTNRMTDRYASNEFTQLINKINLRKKAAPR